MNAASMIGRESSRCRRFAKDCRRLAVEYGPGSNALLREWARWQHFEISMSVNTCDTAATVLWLLDVQPATPFDGVVVRSAFE
jgi:hypothetical protein